MRLKNKVAVVTGGAQGIGKEIVKKFQEEGAKVLVADIQNIQDESQHNTLHYHRTDVTKKDEIDRMIAACIERFGEIDIIVNNAWSFLDGKKSIETVTPADWQHGIDVGMSATLWSAQAALPHFKKQNSGSIISMSSVHGIQASADRLPYDPIKGGLTHLIKVLAIELGKYNIRANSISPGLILTKEVQERLDPKQIEREKNAYALRRAGKPEEVANAAVFLASDESSFVTGHDLVVDGGMTAWLPDDILAKIAALEEEK